MLKLYFGFFKFLAACLILVPLIVGFGTLWARHRAARRERPFPGWYPDPKNPRGLRWFNGSSWTEHVRVSRDL
jgi:hypothetical protein